MAPLKQKGDLAELKVAADLIDRGCHLSFPYGEDCDYDLIADRNGLRLTPALNGQRVGIRKASDYTDPELDRDPRMEPAGFEPATSRMQTGRSAS